MIEVGLVGLEDGGGIEDVGLGLSSLSRLGYQTIIMLGLPPCGVIMLRSSIRDQQGR